MYKVYMYITVRGGYVHCRQQSNRRPASSLWREGVVDIAPEPPKGGGESVYEYAYTENENQAVSHAIDKPRGDSHGWFDILSCIIIIDATT